MKLEAYHWQKQQQPLAEHYLHDFAKIAPLFEYDPWEQGSLLARARFLDQGEHFRADRSKLVEQLAQYNAEIGNSSVAAEAIEALRDASTLVVSGGQQAGVFTGPLLVIYKAITIIQTARKAEKQLNRKVVPVFWIAGEDHDFDEVNHTYYLSKDLQVEKIRLEKPSDDTKASVSQIPLNQLNWQQALQQLDESLIDTEFKADIVAKLQSCGEASESLSDYFARIMAWLFQDEGLVLFDSGNAGFRQLEGAMFERLIKEHRGVNEALLRGQQNVKAAGYAAQAEVLEGQVNLFVIEQNERLLLVEGPEGYTDKKAQHSFTESFLLDLALTSPERLSNNVFTRPLMQEYLFPVLSTVLGSGEISYWGLLKEAFHAFDMKMPVIVPRGEYTLLEGTLQKHMGKYELSFDEVVHSFEEKKNSWLREQDTLNLDQRFAEVKTQFLNLYGPLLQTIAEVHPGMRKLGETNQQKIIEQIEFLENRSTDAFKSQYEAALRQLERIHRSIVPLGKPQDRVYNIFTYLNKYGVGWIQELLQAEVEHHKFHHIVYV